VNYTANTTHWQPGDLVLHDADAKRSDMLMRVIRYRESDGFCQTEYVESEKSEQWGKGARSRLWNRLAVLHDPRLFGIQGGDAGTTRHGILP
jgi:hypothetical protein